MQVAFGDKFSYDRVGLLLVTVGMGFYLSSGALNQAALARGQARFAAGCWVSGGGQPSWSGTCCRSSASSAGSRSGFLGCAALLCGLLYLLYRSARIRAEDVPAPGSPEEIEARLAAADEASSRITPPAARASAPLPAGSGALRGGRSYSPEPRLRR